MLSSISPVGETSRGQPWLLTAIAYAAGSTGAGAATGAALAAAGWAVGGWAVGGWAVGGWAAGGWAWPGSPLLVLGAIAALGLLLDAAGRVPGPHRQVDRAWLTRYRGWVYGVGFGAQLGTGVVTVIPASAVWVMWAAAWLTADPREGALIGAAFGLLRAAPVLAAGGVRDVRALRRALATLDSLRRPAAMVTIAGQMGVVLLAVLAT